MKLKTLRINPLRPSPRKPRNKCMPNTETEIKEPVQETIKVVSMDEAVPPPVVRKSELKDFFGQNFVELMAKAPTNTLVRGQIMRHTGQLPPAELDTFEKLKDWIEINVDKPKRDEPKTAVESPRTTGPTFNVLFHISDVEMGTCSYSVSRNGEWMQEISLEDIREWIGEGLNIRHIIQRIAERAESDQDAELVWDEESKEFDSYDCNDHNDWSVNAEMSQASLRNALIDWLRSLDPELCNTLEGRQG